MIGTVLAGSLATSMIFSGVVVQVSTPISGVTAQASTGWSGEVLASTAELTPGAEVVMSNGEKWKVKGNVVPLTKAVQVSIRNPNNVAETFRAILPSSAVNTPIWVVDLTAPYPPEVMDIEESTSETPPPLDPTMPPLLNDTPTPPSTEPVQIP